MGKRKVPRQDRKKPTSTSRSEKRAQRDREKRVMEYAEKNEALKKRCNVTVKAELIPVEIAPGIYGMKPIVRAYAK